jgi:TonB family protein
MSHNYIWLFPMAGVLIGFAISSAFLRLKPAFSKGYTRDNYGPIESNDLKLGLLFTVYGLVLVILSSTGYSVYRNIMQARNDSGILIPGGDIIKIPVGLIPPPPRLDGRKDGPEVSGTKPINAPMPGIPTPVPDALATDDGGFSQMDLNNAMMANAVNPDSIKGPVEYVKDNDIPESGAYQELSKTPELIKSVKPIYPSICIAAQAQGRVFLNLLLDYDGHIMKVEIARSSGNSALDEAAVAAAGQFIFSPALSSSGRAVRVWLAYPITFTLGK